MVDFITNTNKAGFWTFDVSDPDFQDEGKGVILMYYGTCAFKLALDRTPEGSGTGSGSGSGSGNGRVRFLGEGYGDGEGMKKVEKFSFGMEELKFYMGRWLEKQRHGRVKVVGTMDCWSEGVEKKEGGGVGVRWSLEAVVVRSGKPAVV